MKFYHICLAEEDTCTNEEKVFTPRVPEFRSHSENNTIPRICVSSSIEGCLSAVVWGGGDIEDIFVEYRGYEYYDCRSVPIKVYEFNSDDIMPGNLITPKELYERGLVGDAEINSEYWIVNQNLKPMKSYYITIKFDDYIECSIDDISYESKLEMERLEEKGMEYDLEDYIEGCYTFIRLDHYNVLRDSDVAVSDKIIVPISEHHYRTEDELKNEATEIARSVLIYKNDISSVEVNKHTVTVNLKEKTGYEKNRIASIQ